jgi:hypothetical protein
VWLDKLNFSILQRRALVPGGHYNFELLFLTSAKQKHQQWFRQTEY